MKVDPHVGEPAEVIDVQLEQMRKRRESSVWYAVVGVGLLFAGNISTSLALGGLFMVAFGVVNYIFWSFRITRADDPWDDAEIDAWEQEHYGP